MSILSNARLKLYTIIISNLYRLIKGIKFSTAILCFALCGSGPQAFAVSNPVIRYSKEHIAYLISKAEYDHQIPSGLLAAIAKIESRTKPYALNINGVPMFKQSIGEALSVVRNKLATGEKNIDIGVMQLNYRWHGSAFSDVTEMLIPENNIKYAASLLKSLRIQHGNWHKAVKYYHSATPEHHKKYSRRVVSHWLRRDRAKVSRTWVNS